jgi:CheY-like chemotaxis protein
MDRPASEGLGVLRGKRLLVVDDNATNREIVSRQVRSWGMLPEPVERPTEALARVAAGELFDVAILDMQMPDMDGLALGREIRRHRPELPLLLVTSLGHLPEARSATEFAAQLTKPLKPSQLYDALMGVLADDAKTAAPAEADGDGKPESTLRILLAEDNAVNQKVALRLLEQLGYRADVAWNGVEVLDALGREQYDVVLMDVQMPELDGLDATRRICERWPPGVRPRIVGVTANAMLEDREACFAAGMDDYVAKPIRPEALAEALRHARPVGGATEAALEKLRELGDDDFVVELIDTFLADAPGLLETMRRALEQGDPEEVRRAAHTLKSNGATFGGEDLSQLCRELEQRAKDGRLDGAGELADRIEQSYARLAESVQRATADFRPRTSN